MRRLALLRHAKSSWDDPGLDDFDRPLNRRGCKAATLVGAEMRRRGLAFDLVLASPARRSVETLRHVEEGYKAQLQAQCRPQIYEASSATLLELLRRTDDAIWGLLVVGHNPGLQRAAEILAIAGEPFYDAVAEHYPTAALLLIELTVGTWREIAPGTGAIVDFIKPREL